PRSPSAARCPHVPRSTPHHSLTCLYAPMPCVTPRLWWTPPAVSVCHPHGPHTPASAARPWQSSTCVSRDPGRLRSDRLGASRRGTTRSDLHAQAAATRAARPTSGAGPPPGGRPRRSTLVLGVLVLAAVVSTRWVRLNLSPSVPVGVYRLARLAPPLARGTLVVLPV